MTLDELIAALLEHRTQNPEHGSKQVAIEGCDCFGDVTSIHYTEFLDAVVIARGEEFQGPEPDPRLLKSAPPSPIKPKKQGSPIAFEGEPEPKPNKTGWQPSLSDEALIEERIRYGDRYGLGPETL